LQSTCCRESPTRQSSHDLHADHAASRRKRKLNAQRVTCSFFKSARCPTGQYGFACNSVKEMNILDGRGNVDALSNASSSTRTEPPNCVGCASTHRFPDYIRITRPVSYYAPFQGWLLLSQPPEMSICPS
jgi:hypothetical protein